MPSLNELLYDLRRISEHREQLTEKKIQSIHKSLTKELNNFIADQYVEFADADGRLTVAQIDKARKKAWFLGEIAKRVDDMQPDLRKEIAELIDTTYEKAYKGMYEAFKKADTDDKIKAIAKEVKVNPRTLKQAMNNNISKLTLTPVLEKNRAEITYRIQQELNIGLMNGDRYEDMAKRVSKTTGFSENRAMNIVRTETHRNVESGLMDGAEEWSDLLIDEGYIYTATWCTRKDERVRPQYVRKSGKGWKKGINKSGANHMIMDGATVKVGEEFDLKDGAKAKAPSQSGEARHDCNCRCFLKYGVMTPDEFAKATGQSVEKVREKYFKNIDKSEKSDIIKKKDTVNIERDNRDFRELSIEEYRGMQHSISRDERKIIYGQSHFSGYINSSNARKINALLREGKPLSNEYKRIVDTLQAVIDKNVIPQDIMVTRYVAADALSNLVGLSVPKATLKTTKDTFFKALDDLPNQMPNSVTYIEKGFLSTSCIETENVMQDKLIKMKIKVPKGTNGYISTNKKESEVIFGQNTKLSILGMEIENSGTKDYKIVLHCVLGG